EVRDDRERLERRLREVALRRLLEEPRAGLGRVARRAERPAAGDVLEHDPAPAFGVALAHESQCRFDALGVVVRGLRELLDREGCRRHDQERLERAGELVERIGRDQAERTVHSPVLSSLSVDSCPLRKILIGANGADCSMAISPVRRRSSSARKATACSTRESCPTSWSKSKRERRRSTARNRSRNCVTGGKRSAMWASETCGGSTASRRITCASFSGSCGASGVSGFGASGAGPIRK